MELLRRLDRLDRNILLLFVALSGFGLVQVYSSSYIFATENYGDGLFFFKKQLIFVGLGVGSIFAVLVLPFQLLKRLTLILWVLAVSALALTLVPGWGVKVGGASRWLALPWGFRLEPTEFAKVLSCMMLARFAALGFPQVPAQKVLLLALFLAPLGVMLAQPDFGSVVILVTVALSVTVVYGLRWRYIIGSTAVALSSFYFLVMNVPYRKARVLAFLDPWSHAQGGGFQLIQSLLSFHSGGLMGVGLGQGQGKLFFLPEAHTDFTLAVVGEEMGFVGFALLMILYGLFIFRGFQISVNLKDRFAQALSFSLVILLALSVLMNTSVVLGLAPTKGLTLPFLSYGGSSFVSFCLLVGLLLKCHLQWLYETEHASREFIPFKP